MTPPTATPWDFSMRNHKVAGATWRMFRPSATLAAEHTRRGTQLFSFSHLVERKLVNRIASQKNAALRRPRWREVHEKFTRFFLFPHRESETSVVAGRSARMSRRKARLHPKGSCFRESALLSVGAPGGVAASREAHGAAARKAFSLWYLLSNKTTKRSSTNDGTCMGWHTRHA
jgi:hypothetical protein